MIEMNVDIKGDGRCYQCNKTKEVFKLNYAFSLRGGWHSFLLCRNCIGDFMAGLFVDDEIEIDLYPEETAVAFLEEEFISDWTITRDELQEIINERRKNLPERCVTTT